MKFVLEVKTINELVDFAKGYTGNNPIIKKPVLSMMGCVFNEKTVSICMLDGYKGCDITLPYSMGKDIEYGKEYLLMPPMKKYKKKDTIVSVEYNEEYTVYKTNDAQISLKNIQTENFPDMKGIFDNTVGNCEKQFTICLSAELLIEALKGFNQKEDKGVVLSFYGAKKPVILQSYDKTKKGLLLPVIKDNIDEY